MSKGKRQTTTNLENGLLWFGAGVSIAEILTGTYLASLGFFKGILAILIGHIIGCTLLFFAGLIGAKTKKSAMETTKMSFGSKGSLLFACLNVVQLVGWTAIMIYDGAIAANGIYQVGVWFWCLIIGILILVWIIVGITNIGKMNTVVMLALFGLTVVLCIIIAKNAQLPSHITKSITFGAAVELSVAMPLSWLPLISDYTKEAKKPVQATAISAIVYGLISSWMYIVGMSAAIFTKETDIAQIMLKAGLGIAGLVIIVFSTVTTTFLDAYSAGVSSQTIVSKINTKYMAMIVTIIGIISAIFFSITNITDFLYFIGSVFAPMIAILIADFYVLKKKTQHEIDVENLIIWGIGFCLYRFFMRLDIPIGNTLPDMLITICICVLFFLLKKQRKQ